eukprot:6135842-Lingulodinium_polyedra.AAC.1
MHGATFDAHPAPCTVRQALYTVHRAPRAGRRATAPCNPHRASRTVHHAPCDVRCAPTVHPAPCT